MATCAEECVPDIFQREMPDFDKIPLPEYKPFRYFFTPAPPSCTSTMLFVWLSRLLVCFLLRQNSWTKSKWNSSEFFSLQTQSSLQFCLEISFSSNSRNLLQFLQFSCCTLYRRKPDRKRYPFPIGLRNIYWNLKPENSQDYAQKPQQNCMFMNSASGRRGGTWGRYVENMCECIL